MLKLTLKHFKSYKFNQKWKTKNVQSEIGEFEFFHSEFFVPHSFLPHSFIASS